MWFFCCAHLHTVSSCACVRACVCVCVCVWGGGSSCEQGYEVATAATHSTLTGNIRPELPYYYSNDRWQMAWSNVYICVCHFCWQMTADWVKCLSISVHILLTDDSRLGQMCLFLRKFYWQMTANLVKCLSLSMQILLTNVYFCAYNADKWQQTWSNVCLFLCIYCWHMTADLVKCQIATVQASRLHPGSWWMDWGNGKTCTRHQPNTHQACYLLNRQDMKIPRLVDMMLCHCFFEISQTLTQQHSVMSQHHQAQNSHGVNHTPVRSSTSVPFEGADTQTWN